MSDAAPDANQHTTRETSQETSQTLRDLPAWARLHLWEIQPVRDVLLGFGVVALFWLGQAISIVTVPILLALLLAYLFEPVVARLERTKWFSRQGAVASIIIFTAAVVILPSTLGFIFGSVQVITLVDRYGETLGTVAQSVGKPDDEALIARVEEAGSGWVWIRDRAVEADDVTRVVENTREWLAENPGAIAGRALAAATGLLGLIGGAFSLGFTLFLTMFFFYFVSTGWVEVKRFGSELVPDKQRDRAVMYAKRFDEIISGFVRGRLTIAFVQAVVFSAGYWIIGVPAPLILGPIVALLAIVPYLALIGVPVSVGLLWLEGHTGVRGTWWWVIFMPIVVYTVGQVLDEYVLTPVIQGKTTGLSTPAILAVSLAGGALFGVFGLLVGIPMAACGKIVLDDLFWPRFKAWLAGLRSDPLPLGSTNDD